MLIHEGDIRVFVEDEEYRLSIDRMGTQYDSLEGRGETFEEALADLLEQVRGL